MKHNLRELARVIRTKNCSPFELTMDIIFKDRPTYEKVKAGNLISKEVIAAAYGLPASAIHKVIYFDPAMAVKGVMDRPIISGSPGDTDVYGAQQHAPLLGIELEV